LGFIFGPYFGSMGISWFGIMGPGWVAAAFCAVNFISTYFFLPESLKPGSEPAKRRPRFEQWIHTLSHPRIGLLVGVFFLSTFCFTCFEVTLGLLVSKNFGLNFKDPHDAKTIAYLFAYCGIVGVFVQGGMVGRLVKLMGEPRLIALSLTLVAVSLGPLAYIHHWGWLLVALAVLSVGSGLTRAPVFGLISILAPVNEQGATLGVTNSAGSLARITGPIFAATLFEIHPSWPYVISGALAFATAVIVWQLVVPAHGAAIAAET